MKDEERAQEERVLADWEPDKEAPAPEWNRKRVRRMIWRTRLGIAQNVVATLLLLFIVYSAYMISVHIYYDTSGRSDEFKRYVATLVELHEDGIQVDRRGHYSVELTPWLTQQVTMKLYKSVGAWKVISGEVTAKKRLFGSVTYKLDINTEYLDENGQFSFSVPPDLLKDDPNRRQRNDSRDVWERLKHIGDGYVAEMAFSTARGMEPDELWELLSKYRVRIYSMPVYAGELKTLKNISYTSSRSGSEEQYYVPHLILRPYVKYSEHGWETVSWLSDRAVVWESVEQMMKDIEWLSEKGDYREENDDLQRLEYLRQNGAKVYGAVVTGPVRELEKLQQETDLAYFQLGRTEIWNWRDEVIVETQVDGDEGESQK